MEDRLSMSHKDWKRLGKGTVKLTLGIALVLGVFWLLGDLWYSLNVIIGESM